MEGPVEGLVRYQSWIELEGASRSHVLKCRGEMTGTVRPPFGHLMSEAGRTDRRSRMVSLGHVFGDSGDDSSTVQIPDNKYHQLHGSCVPARD